MTDENLCDGGGTKVFGHYGNVLDIGPIVLGQRSLDVLRPSSKTAPEN